MTNLYRYKVSQDGSNSKTKIEFVSGTDVMNITKRPLEWEADDESPWNCRCESKLVLR